MGKISSAFEVTQIDVIQLAGKMLLCLQHIETYGQKSSNEGLNFVGDAAAHRKEPRLSKTSLSYQIPRRWRCDNLVTSSLAFPYRIMSLLPHSRWRTGILGHGPEAQPVRHGQKHTDHFHIDWVDFDQKNTGAEYLRNPFKSTDAVLKTGFAPAVIAGFKAIPPAPPATTSGTPAWLAGWWKVADGGDTYFYHFDRNGDVVWVEAKPPKGGTPLGNIGNRGRFKLTGDDALQITWNWVAGGQTIEDFTATDVPKTHMNGTSKRWGATCRGSDQLEHCT